MSEENTTSAVDEAIARAEAAVREQMKNAEDNEGQSETSQARPKLTDEERKQQQEAREKERAEKKAEREAVRAQKKAEREAEAARRKKEREAKRAQKAAERALAAANRPPAHMSKVEKAAAKLPQMHDDLDETCENLKAQYTVGELSILIAHLQLANRMTQTLESNGIVFEHGQQVRITSCEHDASLIGKVGTVTEMRKIRVLLDVEGVNKDVYLFAADCEPLQQMTADEPDEEEGDDEGVTESEDGFLKLEDEEEGTGTDG